MFRPKEEYILLGGYVLQIITPDDMILRLCYFENSGVQITPAVLNNLQKGDLFQVCEETREFCFSRDNSQYFYLRFNIAEQFQEFMSFFKNEKTIFKQTA